jgi:Putative bacterial sensory transduction regulator
MRRMGSAIIFGLGLLWIGMAAAQAQPRVPPGREGGDPQPTQPTPSTSVLTRIKPEQTAELLKEAKYTDVRVLEPANEIQRVGGKIGQVPVYANHFVCDAEGCRLISFVAFFGEQPTIDQNYLNAWHQAWRFAKLYRNKQGNLVFQFDVHLFTGLSAEYVRSAAQMYAHLLGKLMEFKPGEK